MTPTEAAASYEIRLATGADVAALVDLRTELFTEIGRLGTDPAESAWFRRANRDYLAATIAAGSFIAYIGVADGEIVASSGLVFFAVPPQPENPLGCEAYVMNMYVRPAHRGRGLGTALLERIIAHARVTPARRILLLATPDGRPLYTRAGFRPVERAMELTW